MKIVILLGLLLQTLSFAQVAQAQGVRENTIAVKTYSGVCGADEQKWRGSGVLFQKNQIAYVLTSNHVLLNSNTGFCHHVKNDSIGMQSATLIASDAGMGLALLKLAVRPNSSIPDAATLFAHSFTLGEHVLTNAYPYGMVQTPLSSSQGSVVSVTSDRHFFAHAFPMVELAGSHAEFGMSGGPVFGVDHKLGGILSHQALMMVGGSVTEPVDFSVGTENGEIYNQVFVIPNTIIHAWIANVFYSVQNFVPSLSVRAQDQLQHEDAVFTDGLKFSVDTTQVPSTIGGGHGTGVGGGHGTGVGGGHGTGVGGEGGGHGTGVGGEGGGHGTGVGGEGGGHGTGVGGSSANAPTTDLPVVIKIELAQSTDPSGNFLERHNASEFLAKVKSALARGNTVSVSMLSRRSTESGILIYSLNEFFRNLADADFRAIAETRDTLSSNQADSSELPKVVSDLVDATQASLTRLGNAQNLKPQDLALLAQISMKLHILKSVEWKEIDLAAFKQLANGYGPRQAEWTSLLENQRNQAIGVLQNLTGIHERLTEILR